MTKPLRNCRVFTQTRLGFFWFGFYQAGTGSLRAAAADQAAYSTLGIIDLIIRDDEQNVLLRFPLHGDGPRFNTSQMGSARGNDLISVA
jgi:hypothetical protein